MEHDLWNGLWLRIPEGEVPLGADSLLLADFLTLPPRARVADLGAGCGTLGVLLCARDPSCTVAGIELRPEACRAAQENVRINGLEERLTVLEGDVRHIRTLLPAADFSCVIANPPYFPVGSGKAGRNSAVARTEQCLTLAELCTAAAWLLPPGGRFALVHRAERLCDLLCALRAAGLEPKRVQPVRHNAESPVSLLLLEARRGGRPGLTLLPEVTVVAVNMNAVVQGGEVAVAAYAVIAYTAMIIQMLIQGVGDGSQPLVSRSYGAGRYAEARAIRTTNYVITVTIGVLGLAAMYLLREQVPAWFGASADTTQLIAFALPIFSLSYVFYGFTHASMSYFYATDNAVASSTIVYGEAALVAMVVTGLGTLFGLNGIWASVSVVQAVLSMLAFGFLRKSDHALSRRTSPEETAAPARA